MIVNSFKLNRVLEFAINFSISSRYEFVTPEIILLGICQTDEFAAVCTAFGLDYNEEIKEPICAAAINKVPEEVGEYNLEFSAQTEQMMGVAEMMAESAAKTELDVPHVIHAMLKLEESYASYILHSRFTEDDTELLRYVIDAFDGKELTPYSTISYGSQGHDDSEEYDDGNEAGEPFGDLFGPERKREDWRSLVTCVNDIYKTKNPLIGREAELDRTIQVLCRCDKNNPLHIGEPGVGKTALVYGLAQRIEEGNVPERLVGAKIFMLDMGTLIAGTTYRGEFEDRIKKIMKGAAKVGNSIIYIDEIHTLIGAGAGGDSALDGSNIMKPYLESGEIRFIGATTYKEFNRYFQKSQGMVRRFQQIDIAEPSQEEAVRILEGLRSRYEGFHNVKYDEGVIEHAVKMSARYITNRFLPDKAIDLIDEAGAYRELHPLTRKRNGEVQKLRVQRVDISTINDTVKRLCKLSDQSLEATNEGTEHIETLAPRMLSQIYGQDEAVRLTVESVMMGKAGLLDEGKPIASMLFVGPTGVGKTEVCKVLAKELGLELVRFDMSEYTEKHAVAKLIGSPAGYVGYEDGGLLTDAIRKNPNCVLLLDEIEKAHSDIYNILLQVMDYARLTDNKGQQADFRHVILIMTSNAGAQFASQASVGFSSTVTSGQAMLQAVKKTFKPEFIGRLSSTVVFNDMDRTMARLILEKKLRQLRDRLAVRKVTLHLTEETMNEILDKGFSQRNGAREIDRVINTMLTPKLTREILFGSLKNGGEITL